MPFTVSFVPSFWKGSYSRMFLKFVHLVHHSIQKYPVLWLAAICSILFFTTSFVDVHTSRPLGDEPHFLVISQTLLKYHSLDVTLDYTHRDYYSFYPSHINPHLSHNVYGQLLPLHNIGGPVLWLIPFTLFGRLGAMWFMSLVSVLIILNIYKLLLTMTIRHSYAFLVSLAYAIASPLYIYSHLNFIEPIGALLCIYVFRKVLQETVSVSDVFISSVCLGILPWVHIRFALLEAILFFALLFKIYQQNKYKNWKYYLWYLLPMMALFVLMEVYSYKVWGSLNPALNELNDTGAPDKPFAALPFAGLLGISFDQSYGLLVNFPLFIFLFVGVVLTLKKKFLAYNALILAVSIPYIILFTSFRDWSGGLCPPARFLVVLLPLWAFYLAYALEQINSILSKLVFGGAVTYGFIYSLLSIKDSHNGSNTGAGNRTLIYLQTLLHMHRHHLTAYFPSMFYPHPKLFVAWIGLFVGLSVLLIYSNSLQVKIKSFAGLPILSWHRQKSVSREPPDERKTSQRQNDPHAVIADETLLIEIKQHTDER
jgi:hypothetical protein